MALGAVELVEIRRLVRDLLSKELAPHVSRHDEAETFARDVHDKLTDARLHALHLPEAWGGADSLEGLTVVAEEMGRIDPGFGLSVLASCALFGFNVARL